MKTNGHQHGNPSSLTFFHFGNFAFQALYLGLQCFDASKQLFFYRDDRAHGQQFPGLSLACFGTIRNCAPTGDEGAVGEETTINST